MKNEYCRGLGLYTRFAITLLVTLLIPLLVEYGGQLFISPPQYSDVHILQNAMLKQRQQRQGKTVVTAEESHKDLQAYRQAIIAQNTAFKEAVKHYQERHFYIGLIAGALSIVLGLLLSILPLSAGFIFGGALTLILSYASAWSVLSNLIQTMTLSVVFLVILILAVRKVGKEEMRS